MQQQAEATVAQAAAARRTATPVLTVSPATSSAPRHSLAHHRYYVKLLMNGEQVGRGSKRLTRHLNTNSLEHWSVC